MQYPDYVTETVDGGARALTMRATDEAATLGDTDTSTQ